MATVQEQRLAQRFRLWDKDGDGKVSVSDFQAEARRIVEVLGESESSPKGGALLEVYTQMFPDPSKLTGVLGGGGVGGVLGGVTGAAGSALSIDAGQFTSLANTLLIAAGEAGFNTVLAPTIRAIAALCDKDDDGQVEADEFKGWLGAIGVGQSDAVEAFGTIDTNGDGQISVQQIVDAVRDFHFGKLDAPLLGR